MACQLQACPEFSTEELNLKEELHEPGFSNHGCFCFWNFPCFQTRQPDIWKRVSMPKKEQESTGSLLGMGINAVKILREWSELIAGPKFKTFIRRFNRTTAQSKTGKFQYDPLSYALNFDEGQREDDQLENNWPVRFAAKGPPLFV